MRTNYFAATLFVCAACAHHDGSGNGNIDGNVVGTVDAFAGPYPDFPVTPIIDMSAPTDGATLFGDPTSGAATGGPCLVEPEVGTLYPNNWLRPRFSWVPTGSENLFELELTAPNQINPLLVYTTATTWTMPAEIWTALTQHTVETPITVSVRGAVYDPVHDVLTSGPEHGTSGDIQIATAAAPGAIVYWTTSGGTGLRGFTIGDETVKDIIRPTDAGSACVGCHTSTPDGKYVGFSSSQNPANGDPTTLGLLSADGMHTAPSFITTQAQTLMARQDQEQPTFSKMHWQDGDHTAVNMFPITGKFQMMWTDLETTSTAQNVGWGVIDRGTVDDANAAAYASFAHTSDTLLYVSAPSVSSGVTTLHGNLMTVPYNARAGGTATAIMGAATSMYNEYYPTFSPDDTYVAFNRVADGQTSYADAQAEVFVIPAAGGTPVRLAANDPPTCSGKVSPGVTNSWPKWAPGVTQVNNKNYYWLTFSSTRSANAAPQLYVTAVVDDGVSLTTYPALYLWNQPPDDHNHTPAWDNFQLIQ